MSILEFDDGIGGRLRGTLHAPGATPGDVLTVGATHGTVSPAPGGGSVPVQVGAGWPGAGDSNVTPDAIGALYVDTDAGGLYIALGVTSADWYAIGGTTTGGNDFYPGVATTVGGTTTLLAGPSGAIITQDALGVSGAGNSLKYFGAAVDGQQWMQLQLGPAGAFVHVWGIDGTYTAGNGVIFPAADPLVAGAWWDNAGVLTKSAGPPP